MTSEEAIEAVRAIDPNRSYCATKANWHHHHVSEESSRRQSYTISVLPGFNGCPCTQWESESFEKSVSMAIVDLVNPTATENQE